MVFEHFFNGYELAAGSREKISIREVESEKLLTPIAYGIEMLGSESITARGYHLWDVRPNSYHELATDRGFLSSELFIRVGFVSVRLAIDVSGQRLMAH